MNNTRREGSYGVVNIANDRSNVIKTAKAAFCDNALTEIAMVEMVPWALKPLKTELGRYIQIKYPYAGRTIVEIELSPEDARVCMWQLINMTAWLHENGILHNDMMSGNVLWDWRTSTTWLIDWGLASFTAANNCHETYSDYYKSPEAVASTKWPVLTPTMDVWAWGINCVIVAAPKLKFEDNQHILTLRRFGKFSTESTVSILESLGMPDDWKDLLCRVLCPAEERISAEQILKHPIWKNMKPWVSARLHPLPQLMSWKRRHQPEELERVYRGLYARTIDCGDPVAVMSNTINLFHYILSERTVSSRLLMTLVLACYFISMQTLGNDGVLPPEAEPGDFVTTGEIESMIIAVMQLTSPCFIRGPLLLNLTHKGVLAYWLNNLYPSRITKAPEKSEKWNTTTKQQLSKPIPLRLPSVPGTSLGLSEKSHLPNGIIETPPKRSVRYVPPTASSTTGT